MNPFYSGTVLLVASLCISLLSIVAAAIWLRTDSPRWATVAQRTLPANGLLLTLTSALLVTAFLLDRFDLEYVAYNSQRHMPTFYKISAFWGSLDGSMLLWGWLVAVFGALVWRRHRLSDPDLLPAVAGVFGLVLAFFVGVILATTNPFDPFIDEMGRAFTPRDGLGLNPLLQNPSMVLHPPSLYLGFTGFTVPFAFALAALLTGKLDDRWIRTTRRWTIIAWSFLTLGNLLGANWAYVELGWGGYWGWDPVENSALMPWFTGTAFLHSVMMQERRDMLRIWNVTLIMATYWLTIFGTFLTRSGVVSSVHAFSDGNIGPLFLGYLGLSVAIGLGLIYWRWGRLATSPRLQSPVSREGAFLFNNVILLGLMFATFWGTVFPILNELVTGQKITVGAPFFNRVNGPLGIGLLLLLSVGPVMSWGRASWHNFRRNMRDPLIVALATAVVVAVAGIREPFALFTWTFCVFAVGTMGLELMRGVRGRRQRKGESAPVALVCLIRANRRRYGGYIVHVGVVLVFIGITGNLFARETQVSMRPGDVTTFEGYELRLRAIRHRYQPNYSAQLALFDVEGRGGRTIQMWPEKRQYVGPRGETSTEVAIWSSLFEDLYLIFVSEDPDTGAGVFRIHRNPLVMWIWIGGAVMLLGGFVAVRRRSERPA